ncbi:hypothetical protein [Turneriella parva]|uniref:Uncharacterized protein n=1 Tax=Turneriella parva (strain ATCC BAA-1111 / DSM 21527 / NCTC 11395 / H) TaxID=869212 RepID=I4B7H6_TURPD|nr:hypothetical protein [Turneriella parva]AFM13233.1 hypothetical protein Turpa_2593 [Turneriella parva DSM 21527]
MFLRFLAILLAVAFGSALVAAKPRKRAKKPAATAAKVEKTETKPQPAKAEADDEEADEKGEKDEPEVTAKKAEPINTGDEMEAYRQVQNRKVVIVQDLADLLLMYEGEFGKFKSPDKRLQRARELDYITSGYEATDELTLGLLAHALVKKYNAERGWLNWLTGWERYALRDAQEAGIIPQRSAPSHRLSGEQLFAIMTDAEDYATKRSEWEKGDQK